MYKKFFAGYFVPEQQLKEKIYETLEKLTFSSPEEWSKDILEYANPQKPSEEILRNLIEHIPQINGKQEIFNVLEIDECLRQISITLDSLLEEIYLGDLLINELYRTFTNQFLGVRYFIASIIISKKLTDGLQYDSDKIYAYLTDRALNISPKDIFVAARLAEEEIGRVASDKNEGQSFEKFIYDFESSIENDIRKNLAEIIKESLFRAYSEAFLKNVNLVNEFLQLDETLTNKGLKEWSESILKVIKENTNLRLEIKDGRGGARERKGFTWDDEKKVEFYKAVESLPKMRIKG
jgi:hypothetical protein